MADLPVAAIVCIAVGCYVALIIGLIVLCYFLKGRGHCSNSNCCAKKEDAQTCQCCVSLSETCDCCHGPSLKSCLNSCCPNKVSSVKEHFGCQRLAIAVTGPLSNLVSTPVVLIKKLHVWILSCASAVRLVVGQHAVISALSLGIKVKHPSSAKPSHLGIVECCKVEPRETCDCCCLEIRLRSPRDKHSAVLPPAATSEKSKEVSMLNLHPHFRSISSIPDGFSREDLHSNTEGWMPVATYPVSKRRPNGTNGWGSVGDAQRLGQGHSQLFFQPGVYSAGRVMVKRLPDPGWAAHSQRWSSRRRSSRRVSSPSLSHHNQHHPHHHTRSPGRRRSSGRGSTLSLGQHGSVRSYNELRSARSADEAGEELPHQPAARSVLPQPALSESVETLH